MRNLFTFILLCSIVHAQVLPVVDKQTRINDRIHELQKVLLARSSPEFMLLPSLNERTRKNQSNEVMRPYIFLQFEYNLADLRWKGKDAAELPMRVQWKTARMDGSLSGTAQMVRLGDEWYFLSFDFLVFPWGEAVIAFLLALAFALGILILYRRSQKRKRLDLAMI